MNVALTSRMVVLGSRMVVFGEGVARDAGIGGGEEVAGAGVGPVEEGEMNWNCWELGPTRKTVGIAAAVEAPTEAAVETAAAVAAAAAPATGPAAEATGTGIETGTTAEVNEEVLDGLVDEMVAGTGTEAGGTHSSV